MIGADEAGRSQSLERGDRSGNVVIGINQVIIDQKDIIRIRNVGQELPRILGVMLGKDADNIGKRIQVLWYLLILVENYIQAVELRRQRPHDIKHRRMPRRICCKIGNLHFPVPFANRLSTVSLIRIT